MGITRRVCRSVGLVGAIILSLVCQLSAQLLHPFMYPFDPSWSEAVIDYHAPQIPAWSCHAFIVDRHVVDSSIADFAAGEVSCFVGRNEPDGKPWGAYAVVERDVGIRFFPVWFESAVWDPCQPSCLGLHLFNGSYVLGADGVRIGPDRPFCVWKTLQDGSYDSGTTRGQLVVGSADDPLILLRTSEIPYVWDRLFDGAVSWREADRFDMQLQAQQQVSFIQAVNDGIWISGTAGLLRKILMNDSGFIGMEIYDLPDRADATALYVLPSTRFPYQAQRDRDRITAGTASGQVIVWNGESFENAGVIGAGSIVAVRDSIFLNHSGVAHVVGPQGGIATYQTQITERPMVMRRSYCNLGLVLEYCDSEWTYYYEVLQDLSTRISELQTGRLHCSGDSCLYADSSADTVTFVLRDVEHNVKMPEVVLVGDDTTIAMHRRFTMVASVSSYFIKPITPIDSVTTAGPSLRTGFPISACHLDSTATVTVIFDADSVEVRVSALYSYRFWDTVTKLPVTVSAKESWNKGVRLSISTGADSLVITNQGLTAIRLPPGSSNRGLVGPSTEDDLRIFTLQGRRLTLTPSTQAKKSSSLSTGCRVSVDKKGVRKLLGVR